MNAMPDNLTVLRARRRRLAKRLRPDGQSDGYDRAKHLDAYTMPVEGLSAIFAMLQRLLPRPDCCVIRGELVIGIRAQGIRRLLHMDKKTGELPTMRDVPRRWLALDLEGVPLPDGIPAADLAQCATSALSEFPPTFRHAACIVQASASHGLLPDLVCGSGFGWTVQHGASN